MTPEQAKKLIEVLQWIVDGKEVEYKRINGYDRYGDSGWVGLEFPKDDFVATNYEYRLKPRKPMEFWTTVFSDGSIGPKCQTKSQALANAYPPSIRTAKFREVIDGDES